MFTTRELVENNVLHLQNEIINELVKASVIKDEAVYNTEVLEWWLVMPALARCLKAENEVVLEVFNNYYWGRCQSGQAIYMDSVINDIVNRFN